jgi:hypothetical protein
VGDPSHELQLYPQIFRLQLSLSLSLSLFLLLLSFSFSFFFELKLLIYYILNIAFSRFTTRLIDQSKSKLDFTFGVTWLLRKVDRHP